MFNYIHYLLNILHSMICIMVVYIYTHARRKRYVLCRYIVLNVFFLRCVVYISVIF